MAVVERMQQAFTYFTRGGRRGVRLGLGLLYLKQQKKNKDEAELAATAAYGLHYSPKYAKGLLVFCLIEQEGGRRKAQVGEECNIEFYLWIIIIIICINDAQTHENIKAFLV